MDVSRKRKGNLETSRPPKKVTKQPPPVRPSSTASLDDISFKQLSGDVWEQYKLETDIEPGCHLALMKKYPHSTVFIHQVSVAPEKIINLKPVVHRNIVHLRHVYTGGEQISMVYEMTIASLKDILSFRPHWSVAETAAVCQSVLSALKYMHGTLGVSHGNLDARTIRVDWNGTVKLSNIGDCLLRANQRYDEDIRALGCIVRELAESNEMRIPTFTSFLHGLADGQPASTLLQHEFLKNSNGPEQLQHCVDTWLATRLFFPPA